MGEVIASLPRMCGVGHLQMITDNERMTERAYAVARAVAPRIHAHFSSHQHPDRQPETGRRRHDPGRGRDRGDDRHGVLGEPQARGSLRAEDLACVPPAWRYRASACPRASAAARSRRADARVAGSRAAGIHLGVAYLDGELRVWGTAQTIPLHCFVAEVVEPGTHRREAPKGQRSCEVRQRRCAGGRSNQSDRREGVGAARLPDAAQHTPRLRAS